MNILKQRLINIKSRLTKVHMGIITLSAFVVISSVGIYQYRRAENYRQYIENQYMRAVSDVTMFVDNIENNLTKGIVATDAAEIVKIANLIYSQASSARSAIGQLPSFDGALGSTSKFLSQVGDYVSGLTVKYVNGGEISPEEYDTIENFINFASSLEKSLISLQDELYAGNMDFNNASPSFMMSVKETENSLADFPSLIYDGPFSDHLKDHKPKLLEGKGNITKEDAENEVKRLVGKKFEGEILYTGENAGVLPTYNFSIKHNAKDKRNVSVEITKQGGAISWFLDNRSIGERKLSIEDAKNNAYSFLSRYDFGKMQHTYYEIQNGMAVINFASVQNDVICYPDLVKIKIALDNGEILGLECGGYISNHFERNLPDFKYSDNQIKNKISPKAEPLEISKCVIPTESGGEIPCYEVLCKYKDKNFLVYLNCETLKEEDILMLVTGENGSLTI